MLFINQALAFNSSICKWNEWYLKVKTDVFLQIQRLINISGTRGVKTCNTEKKKKAVSVNIVIKQNAVFVIVRKESPKLPGGKKSEQTDLQENILILSIS